MLSTPHKTYLTKVEHSTNQYRYYSLRIDPDLFGRWSLFREWGRLDTDGGALRVDSFESEEEAIGRLEKLTDQKRKGGYRELSHQVGSHSVTVFDDVNFHRDVQQFAERYLLRIRALCSRFVVSLRA